MWFKNIFVFAFTKAFQHTVEQLEQLLAENKFTPCASTEMAHFGWSSALGKHSTKFVHQGNGNYLICAKREEKILPAHVIREMLEDRVAEIEANEGRSATKKEKEQFKEDIIFELLPRAFSRHTDTHAYINPEKNIIVVNASSRGKAEDLLALLRKSLGSLPVTSITPEMAPDELMTDWLVEQTNIEPFVIGQNVKLDALGDNASQVQIKESDLASDEVRAHLDADKFVTKLGLEFDDAISCELNDDLSIKKIKFFDVLHEQNSDIDKEDVLARLDADFVLMSGELNRMIESLLGQFDCDATAYAEV